MAQRSAVFLQLDMEAQTLIDRDRRSIMKTLGIHRFKVCHNSDRAHHPRRFEHDREHGSTTLLTAAMEESSRTLFLYQPNASLIIRRLAKWTLG